MCLCLVSPIRSVYIYIKRPLVALVVENLDIYVFYSILNAFW